LQRRSIAELSNQVDTGTQ